MNLRINRIIEDPSSGGEDKPLHTSVNADEVLAVIVSYLSKTVGRLIESLDSSIPIVVQVGEIGKALPRHGSKKTSTRRIQLTISWRQLIESGVVKRVFPQVINITMTEP